MSYVPRWERLTEALERVMKEAGLARQEAQRDICRALAGGEIKVRPALELIKTTVLDHQIHHRYARRIAEFTQDLFNGRNRYPKPWEMHKPFSVPRQLKSRDLDWHQSCFKTRFSIAIRPDAAPMLWHVCIDLFSRDVTRHLIGKQKPQSGAKLGLPKRSTRRSAKREQVRIALNELYPTGIPDEDTEPNPVLVDKVGAWMAKRYSSRFSVSKETILRTAGRLPKPKGR